jgi:hypothetical protein
MKKRLKLLLGICSLFFLPNVQAQIKFGPKIGLNLSEMTLKSSGVSIDPETYVGYNIGVISEITLKNNFFLQPGVSYSMKGTKYNVSDYDLSIKSSFMDLFINVLHKQNMGSMKMLLFAGPYFAYGVGGEYVIDGESYDINYGPDEDMKSLDVGLNLGTGIDIDNFQITIQYGLGLVNLNTTDDAEMKSRVIGISMAYLFDK